MSLLWEAMPLLVSMELLLLLAGAMPRLVSLDLVNEQRCLLEPVAWNLFPFAKVLPDYFQFGRPFVNQAALLYLC